MDIERYFHDTSRYNLRGIYMSWKTYLQEATKSPFDSIYDVAMMYMKNKLGISSLKVKRGYTKNKKYKGFINLQEILNGKYSIKIKKDSGMEYAFSTIAHELTHIKQVYKKELGLSKDEKQMTWKGKKILNVSDYNKGLVYNVYKELPWEKESDINMEKLPKMFMKSKEYDKLKKLYPFLDMDITNIPKKKTPVKDIPLFGGSRGLIG